MDDAPYKVRMRKHINKMMPLKSKPQVREALIAELVPLQYSDTPPVVLLSGGIDSQSVLFALLDLDIKPIAYSFTFKDSPSRDFRYAEATAKAFGVEFRPLYLPRSIDHLKKYVRYCLEEVGNFSKPFVVCAWPQILALKKAKAEGLKHVVSGINADIYFTLTRKAMMMMRTDPSLTCDDFFIRGLRTKDVSQITTITCEAVKMGLQWWTPYHTNRMLAEFAGGNWKWDELNKPREKEIIRADFEGDFKKSKSARHQNFQLGDTGISEHFDKLLETEWNVKKYKEVRYLFKYLVENPEAFDGGHPEKSKLNRKGKL